MENTAIRRQLNKTLQDRVKVLKTSADNGKIIGTSVVVSNKALAKLLCVSENTVSNWRRDKVLTSGKEIIPGVYSYRLKEVLKELSKYTE